jgi:4-hydroxy-tetrahydrodipicolinate synthase
MTLPYLAVGASGVVSVASNVIPNVVVELVRAFQQGDTARATTIHIRHYAFFKDLFIEPNPVPVKHILSLLGICDPAVRLPLCEPSPANAAHIAASFAAIHP